MVCRKVYCLCNFTALSAKLSNRLTVEAVFVYVGMNASLLQLNVKYVGVTARIQLNGIHQCQFSLRGLFRAASVHAFENIWL